MRLLDENGDFIPAIQTTLEILAAAIMIIVVPAFFHCYPGGLTGLEASFHWSWLKRSNRDLRDYVSQDFDILYGWLGCDMTPNEKARFKYRFEQLVMHIQTGTILGPRYRMLVTGKFPESSCA